MPISVFAVPVHSSDYRPLTHSSAVCLAMARPVAASVNERCAHERSRIDSYRARSHWQPTPVNKLDIARNRQAGLSWG